jgi:hypothetical protein
MGKMSVSGGGVMQSIFVDKGAMTIEELVTKAIESNRPIYLGVSGEPKIVVRAVRKELDPEQEKAIQALSGLYQKIRGFEDEANMDSAEFFYRYENNMLEESPQRITWWIAYAAFAETLRRYNLTRGDVECRLENSLTITGN